MGRDNIYDNVLNVLEKYAQYVYITRVSKTCITILIIVQPNRDITNAGHQGFIYMYHQR